MKKFLLSILIVTMIVVFSGCKTERTIKTETETTVIETEAKAISTLKTVIISETTATTSGERRVTGDGGTLTFIKGETVSGVDIEINGKPFTNCVIKNAPMNGTVTTGVVNPWDEEIKGLKVISNDEILGSNTIPSASTSSNIDYGNNPQKYIPHPNMYKETGISGQIYTWTFTVRNDEYAIVGGYSVNGIIDGLYKGFGPGTYTVNIIDGFISVITAEWGANEFDFRVDQAILYGWAHTNIDRGPIPTK